MKQISFWVGLSCIIFVGLLAVFAPWLSGYSPYEDFSGMENLSPFSSQASHFFLLGTDALGRDLWTRLIYGARVSLGMSFIAVLLAAIIGVPLGVIAGYYPRLDRFLSRAADILMAFPSLLIAILIVAILGPGLWNAVFAVGLTNLVPFFKLSRTQVKSESSREYVQAAQALGAVDRRIILRHIMPNSLAPLVVLGSLSLGSACLEFAALSFLNLGVSPPTPEWGAMIRAGMESFLSNNPWVSLLSGFSIFISVLGFNLLGDALRDRLDPRKS